MVFSTVRYCYFFVELFGPTAIRGGGFGDVMEMNGLKDMVDLSEENLSCCKHCFYTSLIHQL